ncbi:SgcJ/EcaC family oxidoreductase [Undibacterium cyanobacteriorum]|uniref:SgcJ/EcaC family oxidoreductase n=1 Tax=Undibacterium cyanobacteriorum TaxID=3073561 RepID=A0ABY9RJD5_9BURK|nr:SgcJ/EcaC family oxidoreductase [Undibacterium sp. 20NA77.5]WMW80923.1 SgcJ/EcaC family oxidoreductase [Undibacterium sp. 20NA77.5]
MNDETEIRALIARWHQATQQGDIAAVLDLMTDDVVFLIAGRAPMNKLDFAAASSVDGPRPQIAMQQEIREIVVCGEMAYMWSELKVEITPPAAISPIVRQGYTLTIIRKIDGRWLLARDANMLVSQSI